MLKFIRQLSGVVGRGSKTISKKFGYPRLTKDEVKLLSNSELKYPNGPVCYFEFGKNDLRRTLYTFFKFFDLAGCNLVVKPSNALFAEMKGDIYGKWVIEEQLISIGTKPQNPDGCFSLVNKNGMTLVNDHYFEFNEHDYYFPITQHPGMYRNGYWNTEVTIPVTERIQSVFFAGNFDPRTYRRLKQDGLFDVIVRTDLLEELKSSHSLHFIHKQEELGDEKYEKQVVIANTSYFEIPMSDLRRVLAKYCFFMAAPGASVPHSHNLAEAMSVGAIPIIEDSYATMMYPTLKDGINALVFNGLKGFSQKIEEANNMAKNQISRMSDHVLDYYNEYMTPEVVIGNLMNEEVKRVNVLSFSSSIKKLKKTK